MFAHTNPLHWDMFQSAVRFEAEAVAMTATLLGSKEKASRGQVRGNMTSGGTESILMAVNSSRDYMKANPELIIPESTHSTYDKAAQHFSIKLKRVPVSCEFRADVKAVRRCINRNPVLIVGSAPGFPHGIMDPIEELGELVLYRKITTELSLKRMLVADARQSNDLRNWSPSAAPSFIQGQGCVAGVLGAMLIISGLYAVLWGKAKEMKRMSESMPSDDTPAVEIITSSMDDKEDEDKGKSTERESEFFGLTAPALVEDKLSDDWLLFVEDTQCEKLDTHHVLQTSNGPMAPVSGDGASHQASSMEPRRMLKRKKSQKIAMEATIRGLEKYMKVEEPAPNTEHCHNKAT
ncbi:hypothetical protein Nepgr_031037 [Nepenthes gracilis]|uniref:Glutamate decarboxylase n=1 Tax=Nepenthes gracilis TaxID=150966 RepID=A0AAD3THJ2_NEPGR|nr:hypothetical protein Nepgr_031037 [Nepenthes gracilis]